MHDTTPTPKSIAGRQRAGLSLSLLVCLLLGAHAWLGLSSSLSFCTTADEPAYLLAGHSYWTYADYRLQPENGVLPQRMLALPAVVRGEGLPSATDQRWSRADVWSLSKDYLYGPAKKPERLLFEARCITMGWSLATGLLIFLLAKRLHGTEGALLSLCFYCFCPGFLAHGALATSDVCMSFLMLASCLCFGRLLRHYQLSTLLLSSVLFGLACVAKFSAILLPAMFLLNLALAFLGRKQGCLDDRILQPRTLASLTITHLVFSLLIIWSCYGFRHSAAGPVLPELQQYYHPWSEKLVHTGLAGQILKKASDLHLLPDAYAFGFTFVLDMSQQRSAFLCGAWSMTGWWQFFPLCFLLKTPLPFLVACLLAFAGMLAAWLRAFRGGTGGMERIRNTFSRQATLWALGATYLIVSITSHLNIGHRHLLPLYPVLFVAVGALVPAARVTRSRLAMFLVCLLPLWQAAVALKAKPDYLAYFNELSGGTSQGHRYLVDSSLDWGQDLPRLSEWLKQRPAIQAGEQVYLSYFGLGSPLHEGIQAKALPSIPRSNELPPAGLSGPGLYCISASMLQQVFLVPGPWRASLEEEYRRLAQLRHQGVLTAASEERFLDLRFALLCAHLRTRTPDAEIGGSILLYQLPAGDPALDGLTD